MNGPVLIALDGSRFSERALPWAMELARRAEVGLDIVTAAEPISTMEYAEWNQLAQVWAADYVAEVKSSCESKGLSVTTFSGTGHPLQVILDRAGENDASLIVAATHGRGPLVRAWLGSVADALLRQSRHPLLLVRPAESEEEDAGPEVSRIALALDGSEVSQGALDRAVALARAFDAELHLVRVVTFPSEVASPYLPQTVALNESILQKSLDEATAALEREATRLRGEGLSVRVHVTKDVQAATGIVRCASESGAEMIVMATHGRGIVGRTLLGSAADKVVRTSQIPVLVVPSKGDAAE